MQAKEFYQLANNLADSELEPLEAKYRTVIGRVYYATYHQVTQYLTANYGDEFVVTGGGMHEKISACCQRLARKTNNRQFYTLSAKYAHLVELRVLADYKIDSQCTKDTMQEAINEADKIIALIEKL